MIPTDPQFLYMVLVLPTLFGLTLMGEGLYKVVHSEWNGLVSLVFGVIFILVVIVTYFFFTSYLSAKA
mgnify:FL=1